MTNLSRLYKLPGKPGYVAILLWFSFSIANAACIYAEPMKAEAVEMGNVISWSTAMEEGTDYFGIFKSVDGIDFVQIGEEAAMGDSKVKKDYRFLDHSLGADKVFYRLLQVDIDGKQRQTHIAVCQTKIENNFVVTMMGNTITDRYFNVVFKSLKADQMSYRLENLDREVVKEGSITINEGQNLFTLDLENTTAGKYRFIFKMNEEEEELVLIKSGDDVLVNKK
jgi:hypothetical protein